MATARTSLEWDVLGNTQIGASHLRQNLPNQDAIYHRKMPDGSVILAVADGHGSNKSFRSDVGSRFAVECAIEVCAEFLLRAGDASVSDIRSRAEQQIPKRIVQKWRERVVDHFENHEFDAAESEKLRDPSRPHLAYGSTLLAAFATDKYLIALQLGDGDILAVSDFNRETTYVIDRDNSLIANETTSLCQDDAVKHFRFRFHLFEKRPPALLLLSTDGYANSFASPAGFVKAGTDFLDLMQAEGVSWLKINIPTWLQEASRDGSGDDITVGIIYRLRPALAEKPNLHAGIEKIAGHSDMETFMGPPSSSDSLSKAQAPNPSDPSPPQASA
jgi:hypothetical protein